MTLQRGKWMSTNKFASNGFTPALALRVGQDRCQSAQQGNERLRVSQPKRRDELPLRRDDLRNETYRSIFRPDRVS